MFQTLQPYAHLAGRILLALIFVLAGFGKLVDPGPTQGYMQAMGVPTLLLWPTILLELGGGLAIIAGFQTRILALLLAGFSVVTGVIFHSNFADQIQQIMFLKNLGLAGGFLLLAASGSTALAVDRRS